MKIAYLTVADARDVRGWSGSNLHIYKALEAQGVEVELIGDLYHGPSMKRKFRKDWGKWIERRDYNRFWDTDTARGYAAVVEARLKHLDVDAVLSPSPVLLAYLNCVQPKVLWTDAGFAALRHDYPDFRPDLISVSSAQQAHQIDLAAVRGCSLLLYASDWGAEWALKDTAADPAKVAVVPFGANIEITHTAAEVAQMAVLRGSSPVRFLFVGVDWERKGADKAIAVVGALRERGVDAELTLVGCFPAADRMIPAWVHLLGFLSKGTEEGCRRLFDLYRQSHFLIVPTIGEAYGLVFAEASAFGVPSLSHRVGGVPTIIRDGVNGQLFDLDQPVSAWADWVVSVLSEPEGLSRLAVSSFAEYQARLNWEVAGRDAAKRIGACLAAKQKQL